MYSKQFQTHVRDSFFSIIQTLLEAAECTWAEEEATEVDKQGEEESRGGNISGMSNDYNECLIENLNHYLRLFRTQAKNQLVVVVFAIAFTIISFRWKEEAFFSWMFDNRWWWNICQCYCSYCSYYYSHCELCHRCCFCSPNQLKDSLFEEVRGWK